MWKKAASSFVGLLSLGFLIGSPLSARGKTDDSRILFAQEKAAVGGDAWRAIKTLRCSGKLIAGGQPNDFTEIIDRTSGHNRIVTRAGEFTDDMGFDGEIWDKQNGIVSVADLPSLVADAVTQAYIDRDGWWDTAVPTRMTHLETRSSASADAVVVVPAGGSAVVVWIDRQTHLITKLEADTDSGPTTTELSDWRAVGGLRIPFKRVTEDSSGAKTTWLVEAVSLDPRAPGDAVARSSPDKRGLLDASGLAVPFEFSAFDSGHIIVKAMVNGQSAHLIFDTGAANYLTPATAARLGLRIGGSVSIGGIGTGSETGGFATVSKVRIGSATLTDQSVMVGPLPFVATHPRRGLDVDGLAGSEFLSEFQTTIDYPGRVIIFRPIGSPAPRGSRSLHYYSDGHNIYVEAIVGGVPGLFRVDKGDGGTITLFSNFAAAHGLFAREGQSSTLSGGVGGHIPVRKVTSRSFSLAGFVLKNVPTDVSETKAGTFASRSIAGSLGAGLLSRFKVTFDYLAHSVSFAPRPGMSAPFWRDWTGLSVTQDDSKAFKVLSVSPASPADVAGVRAGDLIVSVNGKVIGDLGLGVFDLAPLRHGMAPFSLKLNRPGQSLLVMIKPQSRPPTRKANRTVCEQRQLTCLQLRPLRIKRAILASLTTASAERFGFAARKRRIAKGMDAD